MEVSRYKWSTLHERYFQSIGDFCDNGRSGKKWENAPANTEWDRSDENTKCQHLANKNELGILSRCFKGKPPQRGGKKWEYSWNKTGSFKNQRFYGKCILDGHLAGIRRSVECYIKRDCHDSRRHVHVIAHVTFLDVKVYACSLYDKTLVITGYLSVGWHWIGMIIRCIRIQVRVFRSVSL